MSRPATRSKNKRHKLEAAEDYSSEILRKIHVNGEVTEDDLRHLYLVSKPVCEGCRVNSKESPNCFCGLVPASNGTRKSGLWQKLSEIVGSLGPNPFRDLRSSTDTPAGLTNLGATCYANSILQCLYMNTAFRTGIFCVEPDLLQHQPVLDQLSRLFAQLHSSNMAFIDSAPFIKTLELDNGVQQDSHEFLTLFLSLLERSLNHSKTSKSRNMVQDLYRGTVSHVTRCSICGRDSESSSKMEDFYELELNINGLNSLYDSLHDYLSVEELQGENQYFCESCGKRVNATRSIKLRALPAVLNLQLKRYVFLPKTTTRKKITSVFSFPGQLNMGLILSNINDSSLMYDLSAILIHKGTAVNSGHYVAHIKDVNTGHWWEFDDEHVSKLGCHPFGEKYLKQSAKSDKNGQMHYSESATSPSNGIHTNVAEQSNLDNKILNSENNFSSSDAYMLMYCRINAKEISDISCNPSCGTDAIVDGSLPLHLGEEIQKLNSSYAKACEDYQLEKDKQIACITERRQEVKSILSEAPVRSLDDPFFWISADWLRQWADSVIPSPLDNRIIQCMHGKAPASKVQSMKHISNTAWQKLFSKYGGGPPLTDKDYCIECIREEAKNAISATDYRDRRTSFRQIAEAAIAGNFADENLYYVSRAWLIQWLRRKISDTPCDADTGPTASLRCPHGDLVPELAAATRRVLVPESLWLFLCESAKIVKPDDVLGCFAFPSDSVPCIICRKELSEVACLEDDLREVKHRYRQNHEKLFTGKGFDLYPGHKYFLVPSSWLAKWRAYVSTTGKNVSSIEEPESLDVFIDSLRCKKHSRLLERPLDLVCKRGSITQRVSSADGLALITENDWKLFCEEWTVREEKGIQAEIIYLNSTSEVADLCGEAPVLEIDRPSPVNGSSNDPDSKKLFVKTHPEICEDCIGERESSELMLKLNYSNEDICVYLVSGKDPPKSLLQPSGMVCKLERRTSKRSRKTSFGNFVNLSVSCSTSIYQLKMMIWESFGVIKENQKLHKGAVEIEGDSATLADKNIFPGDVLWVSDTGIFENRDIADEISGGTELQESDGGFRGSLLTSGAAVQEWQDRGEQS